jgi:Holliday junction resolvase
MVEREGLFRYKDFGFMDMNEPYRGIGAKYPWVVLASEKIGHYLFIRNLAAAAGVSFICLKGEPAVISMEYFSDDLHKACGRAGLKVFCISDVDPAGYSIEGNLVKRLEQNGHRVEKLVKLVDVDSFATDVIAVLRYPVVVYERKGAVIKPGPYTSMSQVTKARNWFKEVDDERLLSEKDKGGGWKVVTIYGIESDAAERKEIEKRFLAGMG